MAERTPGQNEDHDLLIELRAEMRAVRADIKELKDGMALTIKDHETRIRYLEETITTTEASKRGSDNATRIWGTVLIFAVGIAEFILTRIYK